MPYGIGRLLQLGVAKESTRGTAPASPTFWPAIDDWNLDERFLNVIDAQAYGIIEDSASQTRVKDWSEGQIGGPWLMTSVPLFMLSLLGTDTVTTHAGETTVYDHLLSVQQGVQHQSVALYIHDPVTSQDYKYANAVVTKVDLSVETGKFFTWSAQVMARKGATNAAYTPTATAENRFVPQYLTFKVAANLAGLAAASPIVIKSAKMTIDAKHVPYDALGDKNPKDFLNTEFSVDFTLEAIYQNEADFKTASLANTAQAMRLDFVNTDVTMGVASTNPQVRIDCAKVVFTEFSRPLKLGTVITQVIKGKAHYSLGDSQMIKILCVNTTASY